MVNTPPTKKWHKWFYRTSFFVLGMAAIVMTCLQYKGEEENSKQTYDNFANVISNEAAIKSSVENGQSVMQKAVGVPEFELYRVDDSGQFIRITNEENIFLKNSRKLNLMISNTSEATAEQVTVNFMTPPAITESNLVHNGWIAYLPLTTLTNNQMIGNGWYWKADSPIAAISKTDGVFANYDYMATLYFSTNISFPVIPVKIGVFSARSKMQIISCNLLF